MSKRKKLKQRLKNLPDIREAEEMLDDDLYSFELGMRLKGLYRPPHIIERDLRLVALLRNYRTIMRDYDELRTEIREGEKVKFVSQQQRQQIDKYLKTIDQLISKLQAHETTQAGISDQAKN